jgi:hypothetical protein
MSIARAASSPWIAIALVASLGSAALTPQSAESQEGDPAVPVVALDSADGGFFVLGSSVPFRVSKAETAVDWFDVEAVEGKATEPRIVSLTSRSEGLAPGTYYSAVRIDLSTRSGAGVLLIPVALDVRGPEQAEPSLAALAAGVPDGLAQLTSGDPNVEVRTWLTPARHYIIEVADLQQERLRLEALAGSAAPSQGVGAASQAYDHVFPWMCLEVCGPHVPAEIADVAPNLDAVSGVSYERYRMHAGVWGLLNVGDPGPWASDNGLLKWPMLVGGYKPTAASIQAMWNNRAAILNNLIVEADANGYVGYTVDVEGLAESGKTAFINLMDYLADGLHAEGYKLMVAHATWATLAPMADLARTSVDYVATMDPYTGWWDRYIPVDYAAIEHPRLIWGFTWGGISDSTQQTMWNWMEARGYNVGVAGAAVWRTPLMPPHGSNALDYYVGLRRYYPKSQPPTPTPTDTPQPSDTPTPSETPTDTPSATASSTPTDTPTPSQTPSDTPTPSSTASNTPTPSATSTSTAIPSSTFTPTATPTETAAPERIFFDDFETDGGWIRNASGSDSAAAGRWERGDPQDTNYGGAPMQLGTTVSGSGALVTGALAGSSVGVYDVDAGITSIRSPDISLPGGGDLRLVLSYYLAHLNNSSTDDFLRVRVVAGASGATLFEERGTAAQDVAGWAQTSVSLDAFAGQTIYLVIEAADAAGASLVEAAVDDVAIEAGPGGPPPTSVFLDDFESDRGWTRNVSGIDTASTGLWERADPQDTTYNTGPIQLGTTVSGRHGLVTGALAGVNLGHYDIDGGVTSIRSPDILLPAGGEIELEFFYYLAHTSNATADDFLQVSIVGPTTMLVFEERGAADTDYGSWGRFSARLDAFAGQTVYLVIEAADVGALSLVEAGIDDVSISVGGS